MAVSAQGTIPPPPPPPPPPITELPPLSEPQGIHIVEEMPEFPGGEREMFRFLAANIKYPPMAKDAGIQGIVYVQFVVDVDGSLTEFKLLRTVHPDLDAEALRAAKLMPNWSPGKQRGKPVRVIYNLPIRFKLADPVDEDDQSGKKERKRKKR